MDLNQLHPNKWNPNELPQEDFEALKEDIKQRGLQYPIIVRRDKDKLQIVDGEHRWRACKELGWQTIPDKFVQIEDYNEARAKMVNYRNNKTRGTMNPMKEGQLFFDEWKEGNGTLTQEELSDKYQIPQQRVSERLARVIKIELSIKQELLTERSVKESSIIDQLTRLHQDPKKQREVYEWVKTEEPSHSRVKARVDHELHEERWVPKELTKTKTHSFRFQWETTDLDLIEKLENLQEEKGYGSRRKFITALINVAFKHLDEL